MIKNHRFIACLLSFSLCFSLFACTAEKTNTGQQEQEPLFSKSATLYINRKGDSAGITESELSFDAAILKECETVLFSDAVNAPVKKAYPHINYTVELKQPEDTQLIRITVSAQQEENLAEICNMIAGNFAEVFSETDAFYQCKTVTLAK